MISLLFICVRGEQMWRATIPYGRKGVTIHAISAVDLAIWDLLGKIRNEPVYALLGGKTKDRVLRH
jgi:L-rhamnonate dehydratase